MIEDLDTIRIKASVEAVLAFGKFTSRLSMSEFIEACRYTSEQFSRMADAYESGELKDPSLPKP